MAKVAIGAALLLIATAGCGSFKDRELASCFPNCDPPRDGGGEVVDRDGGMTVERDAGEVLERDGGVVVERDGGEVVERDGGTMMLETLDVLWRTSHSAALGWNPGDLGAGITSYFLRYGVNEAEVWGGGGATWDADDDANLDFFNPPGPIDRTEMATLRGLTPATQYYVQLYVHRESGATEAVARGATTTTTERMQAFEIFTETIPMNSNRIGFGTPSETPRTRRGDAALWTSRTNTVEPALIGELGLGLPGEFEAAFEGAFLELYVDLDFGAGPRPFPYLLLRLRGSTPGDPFTYTYVSLPARQGFQQIQVPLRVFSRNGDRLTPALLGNAVDVFGIAGTRPEMTGVIIDDVVIRF